MDELISREAALACFKPDFKYTLWHFTGIRVALENVPTVDAVPVVHAKWIEDGYYGNPCVCSHCGEEAHYTSTLKEEFDYDWDENLISCGYKEIRDHIRSNFCPNCGAKMDAE